VGVDGGSGRVCAGSDGAGRGGNERSRASCDVGLVVCWIGSGGDAEADD